MRQILISQKRKTPIVTLNNFDLGSEEVVFYRAHGSGKQVGILVYDNDYENWGFMYHRHLIKKRQGDLHFIGRSANRAIGLAIEKNREVFVASYDEFVKYLGDKE